MERIRILFVDDEPLVLQGLQRLFRGMRAEWDMVFVESAQQGLETLASAPFDVVVTDMRMPGMNGAAFLDRVMALWPETIRLVLSGHADSDLVLQAMGSAHQFLAKPCDPALLRAVIGSATDIGRRLRSGEIRKVLGRVGNLPVLPTTYNQIMDLLASETASQADLARVVKRDPAMTTNLLKLVNSAYFGLRQHISDPAEAVAYLGADTLKSLVLFYGIFSQTQVFPPGFDGAYLWRHSLGLASACKRIAREEGQGAETQGACFTAGLLHDVGLLVMATSFPAEYRAIGESLRSERQDVIAAEIRAMGVHHGEVGAYLLGLWGLPRAVVDAVAGHHSPILSSGPEFSPALAVYAAEAFATGTGDYRVFGIHQVLDPQVLPVSLGVRLERWKGQVEAARGFEEGEDE